MKCRDLPQRLGMFQVLQDFLHVKIANYSGLQNSGLISGYGGDFVTFLKFLSDCPIIFNLATSLWFVDAIFLL